MVSNTTSSVYGSAASRGGIGGLMSGLDTDSLVEQLTAGTQAKINKQYQSQQKLVYRQEAYRNVISKLAKFSDKYFSYTSKTNLLSNNFFRSSDIKSSSGDVKVSGDINAVKNFSIKNIDSVASNSRFTSIHKVSSEVVESDEVVAERDLSTLAGQAMSLKYGDSLYTVVIDNDFAVKTMDDKGVAISKADQLKQVADQLNMQINKIDELKKNKLEYAVSGDKLTLNNPNKGDLSIVAASNSIKDVLNIQLKSDGSSSADIDAAKFTEKSNLGSVLNSGYMTFEYNNIQKTITFGKEDFLNTNFFAKAELDKLNALTGEDKKKMEDALMLEAGRMISVDPSKLSTVIQGKLDNAFGAGKITAGVVDKKLSFKTSGTGGTDVLGISDVSVNISRHLGVVSGEYNRIDRNASLDKTNFSAALDKIQEYKLNINGKDFAFDKSTSINDVINQINKDADAGVTITHSATTDKFTVVSKDTGSHTKIDIKDVSGNLGAALFGKENADYTVTKGTDAKVTVSMNGVEETITRSSNNIFFDGVNIELSNKAAINAAAGAVNGVQKEITFTVTDNVDEIVERMSKFVDDYNEIVTYLDAQTVETPNKNYLPLTPEQRKEMSETEVKAWDEKAKAGLLYGDSNVSALLFDLRDAVSGVVEGNSNMMSTIGIGSVPYDYTGKLEFNETTFREKYAENSDEIAKLFTQEVPNGTDVQKGISVRIKDILSINVGTYGEKGILVEEAGTLGTTSAKNNFLTQRIKDYEDVIIKLKDKLQSERTRHWNKFTMLETTLNKLNSQSSWITQQFQ